MDSETRVWKMARINDLSDLIVKYHQTHANSNGIVGTSLGSHYIAWLKELDVLNRELGIVTKK